MKILLLFVLILTGCQDTSVLEEGTVTQEAGVDENALSTYDEANAPFGNYLNSQMTITEAVSAIEEKTIVNPLILNNSSVEVGDSVAVSIGKLQAQITAGGGSSAKLNFNSSNLPLYNSFGLFSDLSNHTNGIKFEADNSLSLYSDEQLIASFNDQKVELFSDLYVNGQVFTLSDRRSKRDISPINQAAKVLTINPVSFTWGDSGKKDIGVIAQQVKDVFPSAVTVDEKGLHRVNYAKLIAPLIEVVKNQQKEIQALKQAISKNKP